ncbi:HNH endonuclease [Massilia sp. SYSU DXS3249]
MIQEAQKHAARLASCASKAGTTELYNSCLGMVIDMAVALGCDQARNTSDPGYGVLFEIKGRNTTGRNSGGQFSFFASRPKFERGVVALSISDDAVGDRAAALRARVSEICRKHGVAVQGDRRYTWPAIGFTSVAAGKRIVQEITAFLLDQEPPAPDPESTTDQVVLRAIKERRGQDEFRQRLISAYGGRCAISGCGVVEALEAAHIVPHSINASYAGSNGLLMRADIHTVFDLHLLSVCPDTLLVKVNPRLRPEYTQFENQTLPLPKILPDRPDREGLALHYALYQSLL